MSQTLPFVHLGARSDVSLGESIATVRELCWEAARDEQGFLGLTDVNTLAGVPAFAAAASHAGLRPLFGAELGVLPHGESQYRGTTYRVRLLVENERGWQTLVRLVNAARRGETATRPPHLPLAEVLEDLRGLVLFLGGERGELTHHVREGCYEKIEEVLRAATASAGTDHVYIELPRPGATPEALEASRSLSKALLGVADYFGVSCVVVPTVRCAQAADDLLLRFFEGQRTAEGRPPAALRDLVRPVAERPHLASRALVAERHGDYTAALEATLAIAQRCAGFAPPVAQRQFPVHDFTRGVDADSFIWNTAFAKATDRYGDLPTRYKERLNREFREIVDAGLANAVVSLVRLNDELEAEGVQRGPGAGLLTNSVIASLLGLTRLDPLKFDLPFELTPGLARGPFPLLELSIPANQEPDAFTALDRLFDGQVTAVGEWRAWKLSQAMEWIAEILGKDGKWASSIQKQQAFLRAKESVADQPTTYLPDLDLPVESMEVLGWLAHRMEGRAKELVVAPSVYTFSVDPLDVAIPRRLAPGATATAKGIPVSEWTSEELGQLRIGRIGFVHPALLDLIGESTTLAREQGPAEYAPERTAPDDALTYRLLSDGLTAGIEPLESPSIRRRLRQGQPADLHSLIRLLLPTATDDADGVELATLLLCHVVAAIKAHQPLAFYAAALSQATGEEARTAMLLEEVHHRGIALHGLDVNYSTGRWSVERDALRPGFDIARGVSAAAAAEIVSKRREMHFADLADFCQRTERSRVKAHHIKALVKAGAFDSLAASRTEIFKQLDELFPALGLKKGSGGTVENEFSFFDRDPGWWIRQYGGSSESVRLPDDPAALLAQEIESCGFVLREAPLPDEDHFLRGGRVYTTRDLTLKMAGQLATLEGTVGPVEPDPKQPGGVLVDLRGTLIRARGAVAETLSSEAYRGRRALLTGRVTREPFQWILDADSITTIEDAVDRWRRSARLTLDLSAVPEASLKPLLQLLKRFPGRTPVAMEWLPQQGARILHSIAARHVMVCPHLEAGLESLLDREHWRVEVASGEVHPTQDGIIVMGRRLPLDGLMRFLPLARALGR